MKKRLRRRRMLFIISKLCCLLLRKRILTGIYLQFLRFSKRVLAENFMIKDVLIIGMMDYDCDCPEIAEDQEKRQDTNRADVDHASIASLLIFDCFLLNDDGRLSS